MLGNEEGNTITTTPSKTKKGRSMRTYRLAGNTPFGHLNVEIARSEIVNMKRRIKSGGYDEYNGMLKVMSHPAAIIRYQMIPGTHLLRYLLNTCIFLSRLAIVVAVIMLFMRHWLLGSLFILLWFLIAQYVQTSINYEIGARLFVIDERLRVLEKNPPE